MKIGFHLPINSVSFGQVSTLLLRTIYEREKVAGVDLDTYLFSIGPPDLSSQGNDPEFVTWLNHKLAKTPETFDRETPLFKLWHLNGSFESFSNKQTLLTFYELDNPTKLELNIARNHNTCFSSQYSCDVFSIFGTETKLLPLAFDSFNFKKLNKKFHNDDRIVFNLCGKLEKRKHHAKVIKAWVKKFGKDSRYVLQAAVYNPFLGRTPEECDRNNNAMLQQIFGADGKPYNVVFYPPMKENSAYNEFLNSANVILGMSGGEGWGLPEFHSIAMGKQAVLLDAHAYKTWATKDMATFVKPAGKISSVDNIHFHAGQPFNQGNIFDFNEDEFITACETAITKTQNSPENLAGLTLQQTYDRNVFTDNVIKLTTS